MTQWMRADLVFPMPEAVFVLRARAAEAAGLKEQLISCRESADQLEAVAKRLEEIIAQSDEKYAGCVVYAIDFDFHRTAWRIAAYHPSVTRSDIMNHPPEIHLFQDRIAGWRAQEPLL